MRRRLALGTLAAVLAVSAAAALVGTLSAGADESTTQRPAVSLVGYRDRPLGYQVDAQQVRNFFRVQVYLGAAAWAAAANRPHATVTRHRGGGGGRCAPGDFACFKACTIARESHGDYGAVSSGGTYRGAWQFNQSTWQSNGGTGDPATASPAQQDAVAYATYQARGSQPWGGRC